MKLLLKVIAFPIMLGVTLIQWVGLFIISFSAIFFYILAGIIFTVTVLSFCFGLEAGADCLKMLAVSFSVYIVPHIGEWIVTRIAVVNYGLRDFIKS